METSFVASSPRLRVLAVILVLAVAMPVSADPDAVILNDGFETVEPPGLENTLRAHNQVRADVGVGMQPLEWDSALVAAAEDWAGQCIDVASPSGVIDSNPGRGTGFSVYIGESIYASGNSVSGVIAVTAWAQQEQNYDYGSNTCSGFCGHYTQLVWATTERVGCAIAECPNLTFPNAVICYYAPGRDSGDRPY